MKQYIIYGGNKLTGNVKISGAKNSALAIIVASIMTNETVYINNLPDIHDINILLKIIKSIGVNIKKISKNKIKITGLNINKLNIKHKYINKIRASYYLLGALLGKYHYVKILKPGGCNIGNRPIDQHLKGFKKLHAFVEIINNIIIVKAKKLKGEYIHLDISSVGATINIVLASVMAHGKTIIENAAMEPHVVDVINFLNSMGANINGAGTNIIKINGVKKLHGTKYSIIPDRIEAGTFMCAAAITSGNIIIKNTIPEHLKSIINKLKEIGCNIKEINNNIHINANLKHLKQTYVKTKPYPGYPTDMQPQLVPILSLINGISIVKESIFENRFKYVYELLRMGANIKIKQNMIIINGVSKLIGSIVNATDLRAGASLVIAGLAANGITIVNNISYIQRGYENFEKKLKNLNANIIKINNKNIYKL